MSIELCFLEITIVMFRISQNALHKVGNEFINE